MILPPVTPFRTAPERSAAQTAWRNAFAERVYGALPPAPRETRVTLSRFQAHIPACSAHRVAFAGTGAAPARPAAPPDAALFLPAAATTPSPVIIALSFLGPAGACDGDFPIDRHATVDSAMPEADEGRLTGAIRGAHKSRWPLSHILSRGVAVLMACYASFAPDCAARFQRQGTGGAVSHWAAAFHRLADAAASLPGIDSTRIAFAGHSRLGKAALWAAATDTRAKAVIANNAGCLGPALSSLTRGERPADLAGRYPHWVHADFSPELGNLDQHHLLASIAPRTVILGTADADAWADPFAEYCGLLAAAPAWHPAAPALPSKDAFAALTSPTGVGAPPLFATKRPGGHGLTPADWSLYLPALAAVFAATR
ncbi:MAG: hypothetical protein AAGF45_09155 [Pseudomonadota bacterium]